MVKKFRKEDGSYIFPNIMAKAMRNINQRVQYEACLMSLSIILLSLTGIGIFTIFFTDYSFGVKIMTSVNTLAMLIFLSSNLVTTYQQYYNYMDMTGILNEYNNGKELDNFKESKLSNEDCEGAVKEIKDLKEI